MLYLIECVRDYDTVYKIGYSKHPNRRVNELKTGNDGNLKILYSFRLYFNDKNITLQISPYIIIEHVGTRISHVNGHVHKIIEWMAERFDFT